MCNGTEYKFFCPKSCILKMLGKKRNRKIKKYRGRRETEVMSDFFVLNLAY